ncbi:hypothetical protein [Tunturiibacter gelidiferens]|uniref:hypothetical protein n=1 Tax=Tunturiibacter gelidiferens TaxID=3069689 RepID=UPI003D9B22C4
MASRVEDEGPAQDGGGDEAVQHDRADEVCAELIGIAIAIATDCERCIYVTLLTSGLAE